MASTRIRRPATRNASGGVAPPRDAGRDDVASFLRRLTNPLKPALEGALAAIRAGAPRADEAIKWNAPSFFVKASGRFFATVNVHGRTKAQACVLIVLHQDAKPATKKNVASGAPSITDPKRLLEWRGRDRCIVRLRDTAEVEANAAALAAIVRQWVTAL